MLALALITLELESCCPDWLAVTIELLRKAQVLQLLQMCQSPKEKKRKAHAMQLCVITFYRYFIHGDSKIWCGYREPTPNFWNSTPPRSSLLPNDVKGRHGSSAFGLRHRPPSSTRKYACVDSASNGIPGA